MAIRFGPLPPETLAVCRGPEGPCFGLATPKWGWTPQNIFSLQEIFWVCDRHWFFAPKWPRPFDAVGIGRRIGFGQEYLWSQ